jgi:hypothetical protein
MMVIRSFANHEGLQKRRSRSVFAYVILTVSTTLRTCWDAPACGWCDGGDCCGGAVPSPRPRRCNWLGLDEKADRGEARMRTAEA